MTFWNIGDEEHEDERFLAWCRGDSASTTGQVRTASDKSGADESNCPPSGSFPTTSCADGTTGTARRSLKGSCQSACGNRSVAATASRGSGTPDLPDRVREVRKRWRTEKGAGDK